MKRKRNKKTSLVGDYIRSSFFGIEDSLVSTTGLIAGVSVATTDKRFIVVAGIVAIAVEAISMAAGEFLSEETEKDLGSSSRRTNPIIGGIIMLVSYFAAGLISLIPVLLLPAEYSLPASIGAAFVGLFCLGYVRGKVTGKSPAASAVKVLVIGGIATVIGIAVGVFFRTP